MPRGGAACMTEINAPGSGYGSGFNKTPFTTLKTALLAPTPMAMVSNVTVVNIGERISRRTTCRISVATVTFQPPALSRRRPAGSRDPYAAAAVKFAIFARSSVAGRRGESFDREKQQRQREAGARRMGIAPAAQEPTGRVISFTTPEP